MGEQRHLCLNDAKEGNQHLIVQAFLNMTDLCGVIGIENPAELRRQTAEMFGVLNQGRERDSRILHVPELQACVGYSIGVGATSSYEGYLPGDCVTILASDSFIGGDNTRTHAEDLTKMYLSKGSSVLRKLNCHFRGVILDRRGRRTVLFNDRYGLGRIYYSEVKSVFYFASQAKALLRILPQCRSFDREGLQDFLAYGCVIGNNSLFSGIKILPAASCWEFSTAGCRQTSYFSPREWEELGPLEEKEFGRQLQSCWAQVVPRYASPPGSIGLSLTGGLDTRMVAAALPSDFCPKTTYTYSGVRDSLDARLARKIAMSRNWSHHTLRIENDFFRDFGALACKTVYATDGGLGVGGAHEIYLSKKARALAPVRLTGNYGGEVLRRVSTFRPLRIAPEIFSEGALEAVTEAVARESKRRQHPVTQAIFVEVARGLFGHLEAGRSQVVVRTPFLDNELVHLAYRWGGGNARQCGHRLVRERDVDLAKIPTDKGDLGLPWTTPFRRAVSAVACKLDYMTSAGFPQKLRCLEALHPGYVHAMDRLGITGQHKYLPYRLWFRDQLSGFVKDVVTDPTTIRSELWSGRELEPLVRDHLSGKANRLEEIELIASLRLIEDSLFNSFGKLCPHPGSPHLETAQHQLR